MLPARSGAGPPEHDEAANAITRMGVTHLQLRRNLELLSGSRARDRRWGM